MKITIKTQPYIFLIFLNEKKDNCTFEIIAYCNIEKTKSSITNLNFIISQLILSIIEFEDYESTIKVNKSIGYKIYEEALILFNDNEWINRLFLELQDDRDAGEWS
jgi:hypothetical protein